MAPNSYLSSIGTPPLMSMPRPENVCNGSESSDRPGGSNLAPGSTAYKTRRFAPALAGACRGLDPVSRGTVLAFTAGRMSPGHHVNAGTTRSGGTVKARKAARDARAERLDRTRRALTAPSTASD